MDDFTLNLSTTLDQIIHSVSSFRPELGLTVGFLCTIIATLFIDRYWKCSSFVVTLVSITATIVLLLPQLNNGARGFFDMLLIDNFSVHARILILFSLFVSTIFIQQHTNSRDAYKNQGEVYSVLLSAGLGLSLLTITTNWLMVFIGIEMVSISSYVLVGFFSENKKQSEATMKYVLFGSVSSAIMLYGLSLIYGFTGNLDFTNPSHLQGLIAAPQVLCTVAILFVFAGIGFKLSFVPFHLWTPDVYEGAPTPITAFLSTVPKIGVIVLFSRVAKVWLSTLFYFSEITFIFMVLVAIVTMLAGNLIALRQQNVKRLLAYSAIGHTGFLIMAILTSLSGDQDILLFYLAIYTILNLGAFAFVYTIERSTGVVELPAYAGMGKRFPILFACFTWIGIALVGLPPTAGFLAKLLVFTSVFDLYQNTQDLPYLLLLIVGALTSVISLFYYFKIPLQAFLRKGNEDSNDNLRAMPVFVIGIVMSILVLVLGLFPNLLLGLFK